MLGKEGVIDVVRSQHTFSAAAIAFEYDAIDVL
jgi:hypothetical protein